MSTPFFSIVIPAYNTAKMLPACLESLISQTETDFEIIIVDDGSTDNTREIIEHYAVIEDRITLLHQPNSGVSSARNLGLSLAKGKYILFVDSDDELETKALEIIKEKAQSDPDAVWFGFLKRKSGRNNHSAFKGRVYRDASSAAADSIRGKILFISACTIAYRLSVIKENHILFRENLSFGEDRMFNHDFLSVCKEIVCIPDRLYIYNDIRKNSGSHSFISGFVKKLLTLNNETAKTMIRLSKETSQEENEAFENKAISTSILQGWTHLREHYSKLSREQQKSELLQFTQIQYPKGFSERGKGIRTRFRVFLLKIAARHKFTTLLEIMMKLDLKKEKSRLFKGKK